MKLTRQRKPHFRDPKRTERLRKINDYREGLKFRYHDMWMDESINIAGEIIRLYEAEIRFLKSQVWKWKG